MEDLVITQGTVTQLALWAIVMAVSYLSAYLIAAGKEKGKAPIVDEKPPTLATRGAFLPLLIGTQKIAPIITWVGKRRAETVREGGSKGIGGGGTITGLQYYESAMHACCIGPTRELTKIWEYGEVIFEGKITNSSHPSGSEFSLGSRGTFEIYWGEEDQPINYALGESIGIDSRWPFVCYIVWKDKMLGAYPQWPSLEYEFTASPQTTGMSGTEFFFGSKNIIVEPHKIYTVDNTEDSFEIIGAKAANFPDEASVTIAGQGAEDGVYQIDHSEAVAGDMAFFPSSIWGRATPNGEILNRSVGDELSYAIMPTFEIHNFDGGNYIYRIEGKFNNIGEWHGFTCYISSKSIKAGFAPDYIEMGLNEDVSPFSVFTNYATFTQTGGVWELTSETGVVAYVTKVTEGNNTWYKLEVYLKAGVSIIGENRFFWLKVHGSGGNKNLRVSSPLIGLAPVTNVFLKQNISGWTSNQGTATPFADSDHSGSNPGFMLTQLLFEKWPHGVGLDKDMFDLTSWGTMITRLTNNDLDRISAHIVSGQGDEFEDMIAGILLDLGCFIVWDYVLGKYVFELVRFNADNYEITQNQQVFPVPEKKINHGEIPWNKTIFSFNDRERNYRKSTVGEGDDGAIGRFESQRARSLPLSIITDATSAGKVAARRGLEDNPTPVVLNVSVGREARILRAGHTIEWEGEEDVLRILEVTERTLESSIVKLAVTPDVYGQAGTIANRTIEGAGYPADSGISSDSMSRVFEPPYPLTEGNSVAVLRVRGDGRGLDSNIWISTDDVTYKLLGRMSEQHIGGVLDVAYSSGTPDLVEYGPSVILSGKDVSKIQDLSGDLNAWRVGRQLAVINDEIFFVKNVTILAANEIRLDGLIRARYGTTKATHPANSEVYILDLDDFKQFKDPAFVAGQTIYYKAQVISSNFFKPLDEITAQSITLEGTGTKPPAPFSLRAGEQIEIGDDTRPEKLPGTKIYGCSSNNSWRSGESILIRWGFFDKINKGTTAGVIPAGDEVPELKEHSDLPGRFQLIVRDTRNPTGQYVAFINGAETEKLIASKNDPFSEDLETWFGTEPPSIDIELNYIVNGRRSETVELTITREG